MKNYRLKACTVVSDPTDSLETKLSDTLTCVCVCAVTSSIWSVKFISKQISQWRYCERCNGNKKFGTIWTTRRSEIRWRQKDMSVEETTGQRHADLVGPPVGDDTRNCRGELSKIIAYFVEHVKIGNYKSWNLVLVSIFIFLLKGKMSDSVSLS